MEVLKQGKKENPRITAKEMRNYWGDRLKPIIGSGAYSVVCERFMELLSVRGDTASKVDKIIRRLLGSSEIGSELEKEKIDFKGCVEGFVTACNYLLAAIGSDGVNIEVTGDIEHGDAQGDDMPIVDASLILERILEETSNGNYVHFGAFPQNAMDALNNKGSYDPIKWRILNKKTYKEDGELFLISKNILFAARYNIQLGDTNWKACSLNGILNKQFYNDAFSTPEEKSLIKEVTNKGTAGYLSDSVDKVFLLSVAEAKQYLGGENKQVDGIERTDERCAQGTEFAKNTANVYEGGGSKLPPYNGSDKAYEWAKGNSYWWLRTIANDSGDDSLVACVSKYGVVHEVGFSVYNFNYGVRPALKLNLKP
jgi:hypothetical protein